MDRRLNDVERKLEQLLSEVRQMRQGTKGVAPGHRPAPAVAPPPPPRQVEPKLDAEDHNPIRVPLPGRVRFAVPADDVLFRQGEPLALPAPPPAIQQVRPIRVPLEGPDVLIRKKEPATP